MTFKSLKEFYPFYIGEHQNRMCKILHFIGTFLVISTLITGLITGHYQLFWLLPVVGYAFAWMGHFVFEKNRPATFKYPFYSLASDFVMFWHLLTGQLSFANGAKVKSNN